MILSTLLMSQTIQVCDPLKSDSYEQTIDKHKNNRASIEARSRDDISAVTCVSPDTGGVGHAVRDERLFMYTSE